MIQTVIFRIYPTAFQEEQLHEIYTIYNRLKRIGYKYLFYEKEYKKKIYKANTIQQALMKICQNNLYVNKILGENQATFKIQKTWLEKRKRYMKNQIKTINEKIKWILDNRGKLDRRLKGLYSRLSSVQNKLRTIKIEPVVFGTKNLFKRRIKNQISHKKFQIMRDSSFAAYGRKGFGNTNLTIFPNKTIRIRTFLNRDDKKYIVIPFSVNSNQEKVFREILQQEKYSISIIRRFIKDELRYFAHMSYEIIHPIEKYGFENGAIGLDLNYNFASLCNTDKDGNLKSYSQISFNNLHTYRKNKGREYLSYKMDKIVNYCINKKKGIVIEDLNLERKFTYIKNYNRKLNNLRTNALNLLERKCIRKGVSIKRVPPPYTSIIGFFKYSRLYNISNHILASYVIARRGLGFEEEIPSIYKWLLAQVGDKIKPRLKPSNPNHNWAKIYDFFKHSGITSFKTSEIMRKTLLAKNVLNSQKSTQPDNLKVGLSKSGKIDDWHKFWDYVNNSQIL